MNNQNKNKEGVMPQNQNPTSSDEFDNLFDDQPILNGVGSDQAKS